MAKINYSSQKKRDLVHKSYKCGYEYGETYDKEKYAYSRRIHIIPCGKYKGMRIHQIPLKYISIVTDEKSKFYSKRLHEFFKIACSALTNTIPM